MINSINYLFPSYGFNLAGMQIMPEGVKMLFNGENIELTCANIDFKFVLSLEKCEREPS